MGITNRQSVYVEAHPDFDANPATRFEYRREPYVRATVHRLDGGTEIVDAKATHWTKTHVCIHWETTTEVFDFWVPADQVTRIHRSQSSWRDPYDHPDDYPTTNK